MLFGKIWFTLIPCPHQSEFQCDHFQNILKTKFFNYFQGENSRRAQGGGVDENSTSILGSSTKLENKCLANHALYYTDMGNSHLYDTHLHFSSFLGSVASFESKFGFS